MPKTNPVWPRIQTPEQAAQFAAAIAPIVAAFEPLAAAFREFNRVTLERQERDA